MSPLFIASPPAQSIPVAAAVVSRRNPAPYGWTTYVVRSGDTVAGLSMRFRTSSSVIVARNRLRDGGGVIRPGQRLQVPRSAAAAAAAAVNAHRQQQARQAARRAATYHVRPGDTMSGIASRHHLSLARLLKLNRMSAQAVIQPGQAILVRSVGAAAPGPAAAVAITSSYRVRSGDTLSAIAAQHHMGLARLLKLNHLSPTVLIRPGQSIRITAAGTTRHTLSSSASAAYRVKRGDTLSGIAAKHGTTSARLMSLNHIRNARSLQIGQRLAVPTFSSNTFAGRTYSTAVVSAADRNRAQLQRAGVPSRTATRAMIVEAARRHGVDPRLALAVAWQESGWDQSQVSVANAIGVMQVIPSSGQWASQMAGRHLNLLRTQDNVTAGVVILRSLTRSTRTVDEAIAGYYQGLGSVQKNGMYADTRQYVHSIKTHRARM